MSLYVRVVDGEVKQVWSTPPPEGETGWKSAIEVHPEIIQGRQVYTGHTFDLTSDPVEIVYNVRDLTVVQHKEWMISQDTSEYQQVADEQTQLEVTDASGDAAVVSAAKDAKDAKLTAINACFTHDDLDALAE